MNIRKNLRTISFLIGCILCMGVQMASADEISDLRTELESLRQAVRELKTVTEKQQAVIESLTSGPPKAENVVVIPQQPLAAGNQALARAQIPFIPEIGVVAD